MSPHPLPEAGLPLPTPDAAAVAEEAVRKRLQHLFRHTLEAGRINPLLHIVLRHRLEDRPC